VFVLPLVLLLIERSSANSGEVVAGGVEVEDSKTNGQVRVGGVVVERFCPNGHVKAAAGVEGKRPSTNPHVVTAASILQERTGTHGRVVDAGCEAEQSVRALSGVVAGIASVRCWANPESVRGRPKPKADEHQRDGKETASRISYFCFHEVNSFFFPGGLIL